MSAEFLDPVRNKVCMLITPPGGKVFPLPGELKIGVGHSGCRELADLAVELDAFYCPACKYNGRVSGQWCIDMIEASVGDVVAGSPDQPPHNYVQELHEGRWRPAVPLPFYGFLHVTCWQCKQRFWGSTAVRRIDTYSQAFRRYERHYRGVHIEGRPFLKGSHDDG